MTAPRPSKNPITIKINEWIFEKYLTHFMERYLPSYTFRQTSGYRTRVENEAVGGVEDSAHLYGLAADGNLINKASGDIIDEATGKKLFNEYFLPYWEGVAIFSPGTSKKRWHIHVHIDRELNNFTKWGGIGVATFAGAIALKKYIQQKRTA